MANSKFLEYQDTDDSKLIDKCDDLTNVPEQKICVSCNKNPSYIAPDWKTKDASEPWLNEKLCKFQVTVTTNEKSLVPFFGASEDEAEEFVNNLFETYQEEAIDAILVDFDKDNSSENIEALKNAIEFEKYDLSLRIHSRVKLLYSIPYEDVASIKENVDITDQEEDAEDDTDEAGDYPISVVYDASTLNQNMLKIRRSLKLYSRYLKMFRSLQNGNLIFENDNRIFYLERYGDNGMMGTSTLEKVMKDIDKFLYEKGYRLKGGPPSGIGTDVVKTIEFTFVNYGLTTITITTESCGDKNFNFNKRKIRKLIRKGHFKDKTAMAYLSKIEDMLIDLEAREPLPWLDFVTKHTHPKVIETFNWPLDSPLNEATPQSCVAETLTEEAKQLGADIFDLEFSLADALVFNFNKNVCKKDALELTEERIKVGAIFNQDNPATGRENQKMRAAAREQAYKQLDIEGEVFIAACMKMFTENTGRGIGSAGDIFTDFFDRVKLCGLKDLAIDGIKCLMKGISFEKAVSSIIKAALTNMSLENFGKFFVLLPADEQVQLQESIMQRIQSGDVFRPESVNDDISRYIDEGVSPHPDIELEPWTIPSIVDNFRNTDSGGSRSNFSEQTLENSQYNSNVRTLAQRFDSFSNSGGSAQTGLVIQLYIDAIIDFYSDDLLNVVDILDRFPGAQLIARTLVMLDCPQPPMFDPPVLDWIRDIELPFCDGIDDITWPSIRNPLAWWPRRWSILPSFTLMLNVFLEHAITQILTLLVVKICNLIGSAICKAVETTGQLAANAINPNNRDTFSETIKQAICGEDATEEQVDDTIAEIMAALGVGGAALGNTEQLNSFVGDMSETLSQREMMEMFSGNPSDESLEALRSLVENEHPQYQSAFPSKEAIADFTKGVGNLFPAKFRNTMQNALDAADDLQINPSLCATPEQLEQFCSFRDSLLGDRATAAQKSAMCDNFDNEMIDTLDDLARAVQQDPSEMIAEGLPPLSSDPGCENGILPLEPTSLSNVAVSSMDMLMRQVHLEFSVDMLGNGPGEKNWGLMNMILSDTMGNPLTAHYRKAYNDDNYVDFVTKNDEDATLIQKGQFPAYVAEWLQEKLGDMLENGNISFNTNNNFRETTSTIKSFKDLNLSLYGGVSTLELPDFGYDSIGIVRAEDEEVEFIRFGRKKDPDLSLSFVDNNKGLVEHGYSDYLYGFNVNLFLSELKEVAAADPTQESGLLPVVRNLKSDNARVNITNLLNFNAQMTRADRKNMSKEEKEAFNRSTRVASIQKERAFEFVSVDDTFDLASLTNYPNFQASFMTHPEYMPQQILLHEILTQQGSNVTLAELKTFHENTLSAVFESIVKEVYENQSAFMYGATYDTLSEDDIAYVVQEGQTDSSAGTLYSDAKLDGEDIINDDNILGISYDQFINEQNGTPENTRVFYLDPVTYGGTYTNPPIYIKPMQNDGWLGLIDALFPELSPCKPSKTDLIDFEQISDQISETYNKIPTDQRLKHDPDCVIEMPYNRILDRTAASTIQGIITAACRIFSSVHFMKTIATFTVFKPDFNNVYSSIYPQYIVENMEKAFKDAQPPAAEFFNTFKDEEFWYAFLEQSVQTYGRLVDDGTIIDPPESILTALLLINDSQEQYQFLTKEDWKNSQNLSGDFAKAALAGVAGSKVPIPGSGVIAAAKVFADNFETYKEFKQRNNLEAIKKTEDLAKLVLKEMVKTELQYMSEKFLENLKDLNLEPSYTDIDYYMLTNFSQGGIDLDLDKEIVAIVEEEPSGPSYGSTSNVAGHLHTYQVDAEGNGWAYEAYHPTQPKIRHKHQIINWEVQEAQSVCYPNCKDIYGVDGVGSHVHNISSMIVPIGDVESFGFEFASDSNLPFILEKYIKINDRKHGIEEGTEIIKSNDPNKNISDIYPGTLELVYAVTDVEDSDGQEGIRQTVNTDEVVGLQGELGVKHGLQLSILVNGEKQEITSVEIDALDYETQSFIAVQANSKELLCLIKLLKEDEKFRLLSHYIIPTNKLLSLLAIYNDMAFLPSIGEKTVPEGDTLTSDFDSKPGTKVTFNSDGDVEYSYTAGWAHVDDRNPGFLAGIAVREWDSWDKELLRNSRSRIKKIFKTYYNSSTNTFENDIEEMTSIDPVKIALERFKSNLKPRLGETFLPWWRKNRLRTNPFDSKGELCEK